MIWPMFLDSDGQEIPKGQQTSGKGRANFYIVSDQLRKEVHLDRIKIGTKFFMMEGSQKVARCTVRRVLALHENAMSSREDR